jgi:hypothetical protein
VPGIELMHPLGNLVNSKNTNLFILSRISNHIIVTSKTLPKKMAAFDRNHWQYIIGIGGRVCAGLSNVL